MLSKDDLGRCRIAAQMAILWCEECGASVERIPKLQALIATLDNELGDAANDIGFEL